MEYQQRVANLKAEFKIGLNKTAKLDKVMKLLDELEILIKETEKKYSSLSIFYFLKLENTFFTINDYRDMDKYEKEIKALPNFKIGILYSGNVITSEDISEKLTEMLEKEESQRILQNIHSDFSEYKGKDYLNHLIGLIRSESKEQGYRKIENYQFTKEINDDLKLKKVIKIFFDVDIDTDKLKPSEKIIKVFEKDNLRCALSVSKSGYYDKTNEYHLLFALPEWEFYNYLDEKRYYVNGVISDFELPKKEIDFLFEEKKDLRRNLRNKGMDYCEEDIFYSTKEEIKSCQKAFERKEILKGRKEEEENEVEDNIKKLFKEKGEITLNGIKRIKEGFFEYQNNRIGYNGFDVLNIETEENDFNEIFNNIVMNYLLKGNFDKRDLECGNFKININQRQSKNYSNMYYVEGIRINAIEREDVIKRAICYQNKKDFKEFLIEVSRCSINIHNALSTGLTYSIKEDVFTNIQLVRKSNYNFILFGKEKYRISNINALINLQNINYGYYGNNRFNAHILAEHLEKNSTMDYNKAIEIIKEGLKGYREAIKRAKELLSDTIKQLEISELEVDNDNYQGKGYLVKGKSGKQYFITEKLGIYEYPNFKYICVIDKSPIKLNKTDLLVSRMYALSNDSMIADKVYTLKPN